MALDGRLIAESQLLLAGQDVTEQEAEARAKRLWSREEYVAALFVNDRLFGLDSPTGKALLAAAARHHVETRTSRVDTAELAGPTAARRRAKAALAALIDADKANAHLINAAVVGMCGLARHEPVGPRNPGFRWRFGKE